MRPGARIRHNQATTHHVHLRDLNCTLTYESKGTELQPYHDELCTYIDRAWSRF